MNIFSILVYCLTLTVISSIRIKFTQKILYLTDIHLDLLYNSESSNEGDDYIKCKNSTHYMNNHFNMYDYGRFLCDPSSILLRSTLTEVKSKYPDIEMIILGGDLIAHNLYKLNIINETKQINKELFKETHKKVFYLIKEFFPNTIILPILGNNDNYEHYQTPSESSRKEQFNFLQKLYFKNDDSNLPRKNFNSNFNYTINKGFYYRYKSQELNVNFISLNSNMFSLKNLNNSDLDTIEQLEFLENELSNLENSEKTFIMMHIPPYPYYRNNTFKFMYKDKYTKRFEDIMYEYRDKVILTFASHLHSGKVSARVREGNYYLSTVNFHSSSPVYLNNPSFSVISYEPINKKILNIVVHTKDLLQTLDESENYKFSKNNPISSSKLFSTVYNYNVDFKFSKFDSSDFYDFIENRLKQPIIFEKYRNFILASKSINSKSQQETNTNNLLKYGLIDPETNYTHLKCSMVILYQKELDECLNKIFINRLTIY